MSRDPRAAAAAAPDDGAAVPGDGAAEPQAGASAVPPRPHRRAGTARDMLLSMIVILAVVAVVLLLLPRPNAIEQPPVDVRSAATAAAGQLSFEPVVPTGLPQDWKPTSAYTERSTGDALMWHIGYLTPQGEYAAVEMAADAPQEWVRAQTANALPTDAGERVVGGQTWQELYREDRDRSTLLRRADGVTTLVTGGADFTELSTLAEAVLAGETVAAPAAS